VDLVQPVLQSVHLAGQFSAAGDKGDDGVVGHGSLGCSEA